MPTAYVASPNKAPSFPPAISRGVPSPEYHATIFAGGATQVDRVAVAVFPVPPFVELTVTELSPPVVAVTSTEIVQGVPTATVAPDSETVFEPFVAPVTLPPPQLLTLNAGVAATSMPAGKLSVNETPVSETVLAAGFVIVNVSVELPPGVVNAGVNAFAISGAVTTVSVPVAFVPTPALVVVRFPVVFTMLPGCWPCTLKVAVQTWPGVVNVPPVNVTIGPLFIKKFPPHVVLVRTELIPRPAGNVSTT